MLSFIIKLFKSLNNNSHPGEIAHAVSCALLLGFLPKNNLLWAIIFVFCSFLRINKAAYGIMIIFFSILTPLFDNFFDYFGYKILTFVPLENFFAKILDIPFVAFTNFNNSVVMGSLIFGIILYFPMYILTRLFINFWRKNIASKLLNLKFYKALLKLPIVQKISNLKEKVGEIKQW
ncbi:MAG: TIGR03546 family protein [Treponema sp.]|nr:TIGR03546 family protein [Treponema sp.]